MTSRCGVSLHCGASPLSALSLLLLCAASSGVWGDAIPGLSPDPPQSDLTLPATRPELLHQYPWMTLPPLPDWPQPENGTGLFNLSWPWPIKLRPLPLPPLIPLTPLFPRSGGDNATQSGETTEATEQSSGDAEAASIFSQTSEQTSQTQSQPPNACQAGHFDRHGAGVCHPCPAGHWSPAGAYSCQTCPAFHGSLAGSAKCSVLPVHTLAHHGAPFEPVMYWWLDYELSAVAWNPNGQGFFSWHPVYSESNYVPQGRIYGYQSMPGMTTGNNNYRAFARIRSLEATQDRLYAMTESGLATVYLPTGAISELNLQYDAQPQSDLALHRKFETLYYRQTATSVAWRQPSAGPGFVTDWWPHAPTAMDIDEDDGWLYTCTSNGLLTRVWPPSGFTQVFNWNSPASPVFASSWDMELTKGADAAWISSSLGLFLATLSDPPLIFEAPLPPDLVAKGYRIAKGSDMRSDLNSLYFTLSSPSNPSDDPSCMVTAEFWKHGRFSAAAYERANPDVRALGLNGWDHYRDNGHAEGRDFWLDTGGHGVFDGQAYLDANEDVAAALLDPWEHYKQYGKSEGRIAYVL